MLPRAPIEVQEIVKSSWFHTKREHLQTPCPFNTRINAIMHEHIHKKVYSETLLKIKDLFQNIDYECTQTSSTVFYTNTYATRPKRTIEKR
jgi:hypothetical protein